MLRHCRNRHRNRLRAALLADDPLSVLNWLRRSPTLGSILTDLASGACTFSHEAIEKRLPGKVGAHFRAILVAAQALPSRDEHLATIQHFSHHRVTLSIRALFLYADPSLTIASKAKSYNSIILPQQLRNNILLAVPEIAALVAEGWLYIIDGDMEGHIGVLRRLRI